MVNKKRNVFEIEGESDGGRVGEGGRQRGRETETEREGWRDTQREGEGGDKDRQRE